MPIMLKVTKTDKTKATLATCRLAVPGTLVDLAAKDNKAAAMLKVKEATGKNSATRLAIIAMAKEI